jgi:hypothetical protein
MIIRFRTSVLDEQGLGPPSEWMEAQLGEFLFRRLECFHGVLPPISILNATLRLGGAATGQNIAHHWAPFELGETEYSTFREAIVFHPEWGGVIDDTGPPAEPEWGHWAFVRSLRGIRRTGT